MDIQAKVIDLLAVRDPIRARDFFLQWSEHCHSAWIDAANDAKSRAATEGHLPQIRGQIRHHRKEIALKTSAQSAGIGVIPMKTLNPGATFMVARLGRFGLVNVAARHELQMPRKSVTRKFLSQPNESIDPQASLFEVEEVKQKTTELAYFGCLVAIPSWRDPTVPAGLWVSVPNAAMTDWIIRMPLHRVIALLNDRTNDAPDVVVQPTIADVPDRAFPAFRLPNDKDDAESSS